MAYIPIKKQLVPDRILPRIIILLFLYVEFNDEFIEESIEKTVFVQGFDKLVSIMQISGFLHLYVFLKWRVLRSGASAEL